MYEVEEVCDRVMFLSHGRIVLQGDPKTLPPNTARRPWKTCSSRWRTKRSAGGGLAA